MKSIKSASTLLLLCVSCACSTLASREEMGAVIARRAQVRSSSAVVAADLKEVVRGDELDIMDSVTVPDTGERWLHVRTRDAEPVEGWIEARNVISHEMIERSRKLAREDGDIPPQAAGQLRASTNIRFSPDRAGADNILFKLETGSRFDIMGWKRVPRPKSQEETEEVDELWYKVRLPPSVSPAPAGWVFGKQVELTVPSDIIFYRTGREFVAWQRLGDDESAAQQASAKDKDAAKETRPGSGVILEKSSVNNPA